MISEVNKKLLKKCIEEKVFLRYQEISQTDVDKNLEDHKKWIMDFRRVSLTPDFLKLYVDIFFEIYGEEKDFQVCGLESASLPLLGAIVLESNRREKQINGLFIRKGRKKHDLRKNIEGTNNGLPVIIIDDLVNTGSSVVKQMETLKAEGYVVKGVFSVLRFRDQDFYKFMAEDHSIEFVSIFDLNDFAKTLSIQNIKEKVSVKKYPMRYESLWKFSSTSPNFKYVVPKSAPLIYGDCTFFGTDSGIFYCLNKKTGEAIWQYKIFQKASGKAIFSSPIIIEDTVFFGAYDGNFYALDIKTGSKKWIYYDADWIGSSPSVSEKYGLVYVGLEYGLWNKKGGVAAIDIKNGEEIWKDIHQGLTHGSPYYSDNNNLLFCGSNDGVLRIYNAKTGAKLKEHEIGSEIKYSFAENDDGNLVAFGAMDGVCYFVDTKTLEVTDKFISKAGIYSTPAFYKNLTIINSLDKTIYCYDYIDKKIKWSKTTLGRVFSSPLVFQNHVYIGSNDGRLYKIEIETGDDQGYIQLSERIVNKICLEQISKSENILYIPTVANELYCIKEMLE